MITVALSQMIYFFCVEAPFTHGEDGIQGVPQGRALGLVDLSQPVLLYIFVAAVFLFGFLTVHRAVNSPFGEILKAIRENEPRAISLGYRVARYKLAAFVLSAALAGLAGATKAIVSQSASLTDVGFAMSGEVVLMTLLGGMGTLYGPVVGAIVVVSMQNYLAQYGQWVTVIQGGVFVACVLMFRRGIVGEIANALKWTSL
jgi:branched-chain amino acid transport system permease protein